MCLALEPCNKKWNDLSLKQGDLRLLNLSAVAQEKFEKRTVDMLLNSQLMFPFSQF